MKKSWIVLSPVILLLFAKCSVNKTYQSKITKDFTVIAGVTGKLKNDSLFRKTSVTQSLYTEYITLYNLQKTPKSIDKKYAKNLGNYVDLLDTLTKSVQNNITGYEPAYSKTMNYIASDVKDKSVNLCKDCRVQQYLPLLVAVKFNVTDKGGNKNVAYTVVMEPFLSIGSGGSIRFNQSSGVLKGIVPGYYKFRIEKEGKRLIEKNEHIKNQSEGTVINIQLP